MNELKILRIILEKQGKILLAQQTTIEAQAQELAEYKSEVAADVEDIKNRLTTVESGSVT